MPCKQQVESITEPMQKSYESVIKQLRNQNAVGVVVAVKGHIVWADMFASSALLAKYWPKLLESYATEALTMPGAREKSASKKQRSSCRIGRPGMKWWIASRDCIGSVN